MDINDSLPGSPGAYALLLHLAKEISLKVGSLGIHRFPEGLFVYIGSAMGPGGVRARVQRHLRPETEKRPHWHIDRLTALTEIRAVWWLTGKTNIECQWASALEKIGTRTPPKFGASDCRCPGHLIYLGKTGVEELAWSITNEMATITPGRICLKKSSV